MMFLLQAQGDSDRVRVRVFQESSKYDTTWKKFIKKHFSLKAEPACFTRELKRFAIDFEVIFFIDR